MGNVSHTSTSMLVPTSMMGPGGGGMQHQMQQHHGGMTGPPPNVIGVSNALMYSSPTIPAGKCYLFFAFSIKIKKFKIY